MIEKLLLLVGIGLVIVGGVRFNRAVDHLLPEFRDWRGITLYWRTERYTEEGQRLLRRAWWTQLAGIGLVWLGVLLGW